MKSISVNDMANNAFMRFAKTDVLPNKNQKAERQHNLLRAMLLNYQEHQQVSILFRNEQADVFAIECSVIALSDEHVVLKSGIIVPVKSILMIELL